MLEFISDADRQSFEEDGVTVLRHVLGRHHIEGLRESVGHQMSKLYSSESAYDFSAMANQAWNKEEKIDVGMAEKYEMSILSHILENDLNARPIREDVEGDDAGRFFYDVAGWRHHQPIRSAAMDSSLPSICNELLGSEYLNFWEDTTFVKMPKTAQRTAFHQDYAYFQVQGDKCCIVWIPLDSVDQNNGPMQYIRGSHKWDKTYAPNIFISQTTNPMSPYERCPDIESQPEKYDIISFDVDPGDVIIHHVKTIHGSRGNMSTDKARRAISFRYCGRLFSKDYPIVWPRPWPEFELANLF